MATSERHSQGRPIPPGAEWLQPRAERQGLRQHFDTIREHIGLILLCVVITLGAAIAYLATAPHLYEAEADLLVSPVPQDPAYTGLGLITTTQDPVADILTATRFVTAPSVARLVIGQLNLRTDAASLIKRVTVAPVAQSNIVAIIVKSTSPEQAQSLANAFAEQTILDRTNALHAKLDVLLPELVRELGATPPASTTGPGSLSQRYLALVVLRSSSDPTLQIQSPAELPKVPVSPRPTLTIVAGIVAGVILGLSAAFGIGALDQRLRREDQLRATLRLPLLRIPRQKRLGRRSLPISPARTSPSAKEAFRALRSLIGSGGTDDESALGPNPRTNGAGMKGPSRVVFIAGSTASEGKTTTALNLATSLADTGASVILIEADLRRPMIAAALGVSPVRGIENVLRQSLPVEQALQPAGPSSPTLQLLLGLTPSGELAGRLSRVVVRRIVDEARALADYVVVDAPSMTEVSDGLPLASEADDIIVVTRLNVTRLGTLADLGELLLSHGLRPTGVALIGVEDANSSGRIRLGRLRRRRGYVARRSTWGGITSPLTFPGPDGEALPEPLGTGDDTIPSTETIASEPNEPLAWRRSSHLRYPS